MFKSHYAFLASIVCILFFHQPANANSKNVSIAFTSEPSGAEVHVQNFNKKGLIKRGQSCITPCKIEIKLEKDRQIFFSHPEVDSGYIKARFFKYSDGDINFLSYDLGKKNPEPYLSRDYGLSRDGRFHIKLKSAVERRKALALYQEQVAAANKRYEESKQKEKETQLKANLAQEQSEITQCPADIVRHPSSTSPTNIRQSYPQTPRKAKKSGHCKVKYDVNSLGATTNVRAVSCTDKIFEKPSLESVKKYYYDPSLPENSSLPYCNIERQVSYRIIGKDGKLIPE